MANATPKILLVELFIMFQSKWFRSTFQVQVKRVLMKGARFIAPRFALQVVYAVRIPGGLTPP